VLKNLLALDLGNSNIMMGLFVGKDAVSHYRFKTDLDKTPDEYQLLISDLLQLGEIGTAEIEMSIMCSVVPRLTPVLCQALTQIFDLEPLVVTEQLDLGIKNLYDQPAEVGSDRLVNAVAASCLHPLPAVVVDFGTATTFDVVSRDKEYLGGVICPGVETSSAHLFERAARLSSVELAFPGKVIGTNTGDSLRSGILLQASTSLEGIINLIEKEMKQKATVIATGGLSPLIAALTKRIDVLDRLLTLKGLQIIAERVVERGHPH
jgi:type III pantothenate kinase